MAKKRLPPKWIRGRKITDARHLADEVTRIATDTPVGQKVSPEDEIFLLALIAHLSLDENLRIIGDGVDGFEVRKHTGPPKRKFRVLRTDGTHLSISVKQLLETTVMQRSKQGW